MLNFFGRGFQHNSLDSLWQYIEGFWEKKSISAGKAAEIPVTCERYILNSD